MSARALADAVVVLHACFVVFVLAGALLVLRHRGVAIVHLPAVAWAAWVEFTGTICPLTPLENALRREAGVAGYPGGFVEHYAIPVLYPEGLTAGMQIAFGTAVIAINAMLYVVAWRRSRRAIVAPRRPIA
jgi:hypothetical protein